MAMEWLRAYKIDIGYGVTAFVWRRLLFDNHRIVKYIQGIQYFKFILQQIFNPAQG